MSCERLAAIREIVESLSRSGCRFIVHGSARFTRPSRKSPNDLDLVVAANDLPRLISALLEQDSDLCGESWQETFEVSILLTARQASQFCETHKSRFYLRLKFKDLQIDVTYSGVVFERWRLRLSPLSRVASFCEAPNDVRRLTSPCLPTRDL